METSQKIFQFADWIFADVEEKEICNQYYEYQSCFEAEQDCEVKLYISAYSEYVVYLNGSFVNCGQYDDLEHYQVYDVLDLSPYLKCGKNELYIGHYVAGDNFFTCRKQIPGIIFAVWSGEKMLLSSNRECLSRRNDHFLKCREKITKQVGFNFEYDATAEELPYAPSAVAPKEKNLYVRPIKKLELEDLWAEKVKATGIFKENHRTLPKAERMYTAYLSANMAGEMLRHEGGEVVWDIPKEKGADGAYMIFDLGGESTGLLEFALDVAEETEVLIGYGEHLDDMRVRCAPVGRSFCFRYIAHKGHNEFFYPYLRMGLRYLQFHVYSNEGKLRAGIRKQTYGIYEC